MSVDKQTFYIILRHIPSHQFISKTAKGTNKICLVNFRTKNQPNQYSNYIR